MLKSLVILFGTFFVMNLQAQEFEQYGLEDQEITDLKIYADALFAGADNGVYVRKHADSSWACMGLEGIKILSVYPHDVGPIGWGVTVGVFPSQTPGDSALTYCWTTYSPRWTPSDSGMDRSMVDGIYALDGIPDPRI